MQTRTMVICAGAVLTIMSLACGEDYVEGESECGRPGQVECGDPPCDALSMNCEMFPEDMSTTPADMTTTPADMTRPADMSTPPADMQTPADMATPEDMSPVDMGPPPCGNDEQRCGGACVSVQDNSQHCGQCGNACGGGSACVGTACVEVSDLAQVVAIANMHRATGYNCGGQQMPATSPLVMDSKLQLAAQLHAEDMAQNNYFDHTSQDGRSFSTRITDAGYTASPRGENIAAGNGTPESTMTQWMNSPGHCKNIMNAGFNEIGVGHGTGGRYGHYWVQTFGHR